MPVEVPKEPKNYTTVYDNFKGVDFTNDASNIYRRRSPTGVNMLPDLDGRPYKRTGWEVTLTNTDYVVALGAEEYDPEASYSVGDYTIYNEKPYICNHDTEGEEWDETHWDVVEVEPQRTHHFSYDSFDFLMIFNSLGVFYYNNKDYTVYRAQMWENNQASDFPPEVTRDVDGVPTLVTMPADANRAFFFEGAGTAGFYTFVESDLYRFGGDDAGNYYYYKVTPTIPIILVGCEPATGVGTKNQAINMLTDKRTLEYFGDGTTEYQLPTTPDVDSIGVKVLNTNTGEWEDKAKTTDWSWTSGKVKFTVAPAASTVGNVQITYAPSSESVYSLVSNVETNRVKLTNTWKQTQERYLETIKTYKWDKKKKKWVSYKIPDYETVDDTGWFATSTKNTPATATLSLSNLYSQNTLKIKANYSGSFVNVTPNKKKWGAYNSKIDVTFSDAAIAKSGTTKTTTSAWKTLSTQTDVWSDDYDKFKAVDVYQRRTRTITKSKTYTVYGTYTQQYLLTDSAQNKEQKDAFNLCRKVLNFGNNISNQVFLSSTTARDYRNRVWYCAANDPAYFPDTNYIEVGADDKEVMGLIKAGGYLGIVKKGSGTETSIYFAYATSFEDETTYAVRQGVSGIGAISNGAFNILNDEPLFLSSEGIIGINAEETDVNKQVRNRSFYINKRLKAEERPENAISYVHKGLYYLAVNNHCYVLDGSQKTSWANEKTNLQYECYYLENTPVQCFASFDGDLCFVDNDGRLCRFKRTDDDRAYVDDYPVNEADWIATKPPEDDEFNLADLGGASDEYGYLIGSDDDYLCVYPDTTKIYDSSNTYSIGDFVLYEDRKIYVCTEAILTPEPWTPSHWEEQETDRIMVMVGQAGINATISYFGDYYTITDVITDEEAGTAKAAVAPGVPIYAEWSTIADDDDMVHFFKNLRKKGCVVSLLPDQGSYVRILIRADEKEPVDLGYLDVGVTELPADLIVKKKIKKYKRLQFIIRDDWYDDGFALDQIIKTYTVGNYSKNRK